MRHGQDIQAFSKSMGVVNICNPVSYSYIRQVNRLYSANTPQNQLTELLATICISKTNWKGNPVNKNSRKARKMSHEMIAADIGFQNDPLKYQMMHYSIISLNTYLS